MKSHVYNFRIAEALKWIATPLVPVLIFSCAIHISGMLKLLPRPLPIHDIDRTIIFHQAIAAAENTNATIVLVGDSSCLVDVDARNLQKFLAPSASALNLGTLSYLDLDSYGFLLKRHLSGRADRPTVVLLMHPQALRLGISGAHYGMQLRALMDGEHRCEPETSTPACLLGRDIVRDCFVSRILPVALPGKHGELFGFNKDLWQSISEHNGSSIDPNRYNAKTAEGNAEYRLSNTVEEASKLFREQLPKDVKLVVGITPCPQTFVLPNHAATVQRILQQWSKALQADRTLPLPATMPDKYFASPTHLNAEGQAVFTCILGGILSTNF